MSDITMCLNENCTKKKDCYRSMAKTDGYQSFAMFDCSEENKWYAFWEIESKGWDSTSGCSGGGYTDKYQGFR